MQRSILPATVLLLSLGLLASAGGRLTRAGARAADRAPQPIRSFTLKDAEDKAFSLDDYKDGKAIVIAFIGTECPINNAYMPRLAEYHKEYAPRGVRFLAINSNAQDTPVRMAAHARDHGIPFPVLKDPANVVADRFGARRTPEVFVLNPSGAVLYQGRIDDQFGIGYKRTAPTRRDLAAALDEVLAGKPVTQPLTPVAGCLIGRTIPAHTDGSVTYARQVAPILQNRCQECHRPGQAAPMSLLAYEDALGWADMIREVVQDRRMPPWYADPRYGHFSNDRSLSKEERDTLLSWIEQGCPRGDSRDLPPAREFPKGWGIGTPDAVFSMPTNFPVPAKAERNGLPYKYITVKTNFDEDRWIVAAEARPGNRAIVHHIIVYLLEERQKPREQRIDGIGDGMLVAYAPGDMPAVFPPGTAKKLPRGATLVFQMHYTPNGVAQSDRSSVGFIFAKEPPKFEARTRAIAQRRLEIPAGDKNYEAHSSSTFTEDADLLSLMLHMHLRGKDFEYRVVFPDGKSETLLRVPHYDFNWQSNYRLTKPLHLPAGTRIDCTAHFDNSTENPNNPDPSKKVTWGEQTWDEMMIGFVDYVFTRKQK